MNETKKLREEDARLRHAVWTATDRSSVFRMNARRVEIGKRIAELQRQA